MSAVPEIIPLRIIHCFRAPTGGVFRHIRDLTREQIRAGHSVGIICDATQGDAHDEALLADFQKELDLEVHRLPMARGISPSDLWISFKTWRLLKKTQPDIVHCHTAKGGVFGRLAGKLASLTGTKVKTLYSPHGGSLHFDPKSLKGRIFFTAERFLEWIGDHLVFVCAYERDTYAAKIGKPSANTIVFNGLQPDEFNPVSEVVGAADFLFIGMMRDLKGADIFIEAIAKLDEATAIMVGDGPDLERYQNRVIELNLQDHVTFKPAMNARIAFGLARSVVVPSRAEAFPYLVLEAIAAHKPLIATRVGGIPEIMGENSDQLIPAEDATALADAMQSLKSAPMTTAELAHRAQELEKLFSVSTMADQIEAIYRETSS